jgi:hypothetical protein
MSHNQRLYWLRTLGFTPEDWGADLKELGRAVCVKGIRQGQAESFWLAAGDGSAVVHGENTPVKTWEELQAWITEQPEVKKPLAAQRNLFDLDKD